MTRAQALAEITELKRQLVEHTSGQCKCQENVHRGRDIDCLDNQATIKHKITTRLRWLERNG